MAKPTTMRGHGRVRTTIGSVLGLVATALAVTVAPAPASATNPYVVTTPAAVCTGWTSVVVPNGVSSVTAVVIGGGGGGGSGATGSPGGGGARVAVTTAVTPGQTLWQRTGCGGSGWDSDGHHGEGGSGYTSGGVSGEGGSWTYKGGGGGGSSAICIGGTGDCGGTGAVVLAIAGGGGGGGAGQNCDGSGTTAGVGGRAGAGTQTTSTNTYLAANGNGGGTGGNGGGSGGGGGTHNGVGTVGSNLPGTDPTNGSGGTGGKGGYDSGNTYNVGGGGGGGGWYGGAGGGADWCYTGTAAAGAGGAGSSYINLARTTSGTSISGVTATTQGCGKQSEMCGTVTTAGAGGERDYTASAGSISLTWNASPVAISVTPSATGNASSTATIGAYTVALKDYAGNNVNAEVATTINLASNSTGTKGFSTTSGGAISGSSFVIPAGSATGTFYYGDSKVGTATLTVSSSGYANVTAGANVTARATSTGVSCSPTSVQQGATSTCTVTVTDTAAGGKITPTGTLSFSSPSGSLGPLPCTLAQSSVGVATCSVNYANQTGGSYSIGATYTPTSAHVASNGSGPITVANPTTTQISCSPSPASAGNDSQCTVIVTDAGTITTPPSGTVSLSATPAGLTMSGPCTLALPIGSSKFCGFTVNSATLGTYSLTATYASSDGHTASSGTGSLTFGAHPTSTTVSCTSPVQHGVTSTCTATVTDSLASGTKITPTGTVAGSAPSGTIGSSPCTLAQVSLGTARCSFTYTAPSAGTVTVTGTYAPSSVHTTSSGTSDVTVSNPTTTTVVCSSSPVPAQNSSTCTLTVTDTGASPAAPAGTVALSASPGVLSISGSPCTLANPVGASRSCTVTVSGNAPTTYTLTGTYTSSDGHGSSQGTTTLVVSRHASATTVSCTPGSLHRDEVTTCTATVVDTLNPGTKISPLGTVTATAPSGSFTSSPCTLSAGFPGMSQCTFTYSSTTPGAVTITGTYAATSSHLTSSGTAAVTVAAPTADAQSVDAHRGVPLVINLTGADPLGGPVTFTAPVDAPTKGSLDCTDATCTYTAGAGSTGSDSFTFRVTDDHGAATTATVSIAIVNDAPIAAGQAVGATAQAAKPITLSATDPNGDPITFHVATQPTKGTVSCSTTGACTYTSTGNGFGADSFTFTADDGFGGTDTETVSIAITAPAPTISGGRTPAANVNGWNNEPVTVSFTCGSDALESCTPPVTVSSNGAGQSVTGTAQDIYGQTTSTTVSDINVDLVDPSLIGVATTAPNAAGWYNAPVTMAWTCDDALSGITSGVCPSASTTVGEGAAVSVSESVNDRAGNHVSATSESVMVDLTAPSTGVSTPPTWSNSTVTLTLTPSDALSGVATTEYRVDGGPDQTGTAPVVSGQGHHVVTFWSTDEAGNEEAHASVGVDIDTSAPSIHATVTPAANGAGWHKGSAAVTFTCDDTDSGVASCTGDTSFSTEVDTVVTGHAADHAGNTATDTATVRIDLSDPTIAAQVPAANSAGWFNSPVQVPFSCSDTGGSGVASCPSPVVFAGDGANQSVTGTVTDNAGNQRSTSGSTVSVDLTAPTITGAAMNGSNGNGGYYGAVTVHWTCNDALSGVVSCPADQVVSGEGVHVVSRSVSDRAGNTSTGEVTIRIDHDPSTDPGFIHGRITDRVTGGPVAGATVTLRDPNRAIVAIGTAGTDGTYSFPALPDGSYRLYAELKNAYQGSYWPTKADFLLATPITVVHGSNITADQALAPGLVISGTVRNASGNPVAGATVRLAPTSIAAVTDADGRYLFKGLYPGSYTVSFSAFGYDPYTTPSTVLSGDRVLDRTMTAPAAGGGLKGRVTSFRTGAPLAGAEVRIWTKDAAVPGLIVTTGADGRYSVASLPVGSYEVSVIRIDYQTRWAPDSLSRPAVAYPVTTGCTTTPEATWGDPCAVPVNLAMRN